MAAELRNQLEAQLAKTPVDDGAVLDMLKRIVEVPMTLELLKATSIGRTVNNARKADGASQATKDLAASIRATWKAKFAKKPSPAAAVAAAAKPTATATAAASPAAGGAAGKERRASAGGGGRKFEDAIEEIPKYDDRFRMNVCKMLGKALFNKHRTLRVAPMEGALDPIKTAVSIEKALHNEITHTSGGSSGNDKHKKKLKMFVANINSTANPDLAIQILTGKIAPEKFVGMTPGEMQSDEMKKKKEEANVKAMNDAFMAIKPGAISKSIRCGKCGAKETEYTQRQTRSADEPMTTFCVCLKCGNRWRFC